MTRAVVAIYVDPDFFPPTINAILNLAGALDEVVVISRDNSVADYPYPPNVTLKKIGPKVPVRDMEKQGAWQKVFYFFRFTAALRKEAKHKNNRLVLMYDPFALFAFFLIKRIRLRNKIWYHNHDMPAKTMAGKFSIGFFSAKYEATAMKYVHLFSLPSRERLQYYPELPATIPVFILPNYPSLKVYRTPVGKDISRDIIRIIYQGFIGAGHSLETFIQLLPESVKGYQLQLVLKGSVTTAYREYLNSLAEKYGVTERVRWEGIGAYADLPRLTAACDIGIGINMNEDPVSQTQGTSSNKIYEYAASSLPVVLYDSEQFRKYLEEYNWTFFTNGSADSIRICLKAIIDDLQSSRKSARYAFEKSLNFEEHFIPALQSVLNTVDNDHMKKQPE